MPSVPFSSLSSTDDTPVSIGDYIKLLNAKLRSCEARIVGEVAELKQSTQGHVYFSLKDPKDNSVLPCVIWGTKYAVCGVKLENGMEIVASGYPDVYAPWGKMTFKADTIELVGEGALKKAYDALKKKLTEEGLFAESKKRPVPEYVHTIGVITSMQGAVIHDFTNNLGKFGYRIEVMDARVEGQEAVKELLLAVRSFRKRKIDALVIIRGGGSLQSLLAFDNEMLVREVSSFPVPVIAGIGHHQDVTLVALAADAAESTPTATAHLLNRSWQLAINKVAESERTILGQYEERLGTVRHEINECLDLVTENFGSIFERYREVERKLMGMLPAITYALQNKRRLLAETPKTLIRQYARGLQEARGELGTAWQKNIVTPFAGALAAADSSLSVCTKVLTLNDPRRQLRLGYSIARVRGTVLRSVKGIEKGVALELMVADGTLDAEVRGVTVTK